MLLVRKTLAWLLSLLLLACLLTVTSTAAFDLNFSKPDHIESWLQQSNIYGHFVTNVIDQSKQTTGGQDDSSVSLSDTAVQQAAESAFTPSLIQQDINTFIDSNFDWLHGKTDKPNFNIDLSTQKQQFAETVGQYVNAYLKTLPVCTSAQLAQITNPNGDPLSLSCRPSSLNPTTEGIQISDQLANSSDFLGTTRLTADSVSSSNQNSQPYYARLASVPKTYQLIIKLPWILGGLALLLSICVILVAPRHRKGFRRVGFVFITAGVILLVEKFVADTVVKHLNINKLNFFNPGGGSSSGTAGPMQQSLLHFVRIAEAAITRTNVYFGIGFLVIGAIIITYIIASRERKPRAPKQKPILVPQVDETVTDSEPVAPAPTSARPAAGRPVLDIARPNTRPTTAPALPRLKPKSATTGKKPTRKPPRLIQ